MISVLMASLALAQSGTDCVSSDAFPVAGTVGYANGTEALRVNAVTYSATSFAERNLFLAEGIEAVKSGDKERGSVDFVYEFNNTFNAARVPMWTTQADCPEDLRFATHPLDLLASNMGIVGRFGPVGFYYAAGFVYGSPSNRSRFQRYAGAVAGYPIIMAGPLLAAPLLGSRHVIQGSSAWAADSLGGVVIDARYVEIRAGWTGSRGLHASFTEQQLGFFGNTVLTHGLQEVGQFAAGLRRFGPGAVADTVGHTSLFGRGLPLTEAIAPAGTAERPTSLSLLTGHLQQEDIAGRLDVAAAVATAPTTLLHEARVGVHSLGYHDGDDAGSGEFTGRYLLQGGVVELPEQWYYGQPGGRYPHVRAEGKVVTGSDAGRFEVAFTLMINDAEHLSLYPFAVNSAHYRLTVQGAL